MACEITNGLTIDCNGLRKTGGVNKRAFLFNIDDLTDYGYTGTGTSGYINALNFESYQGLYEFTSRKEAHSGGYTVVNAGDGGNKYYQHDVQLKLFSDTPTEDEVLEALLVAEVGIILETNNKEFILYGGFNGMDQDSGNQNTGQTAESDIADVLVFQGEEELMPKRILVTDYETTKNYLETLVV